MSSVFGFLNKKRNNDIISVQEFALKIIGMRVTYMYKTVYEGSELRLGRYRELFDGEVRYELEKSVPCTNAWLAELMNNCNVPKWDGFHGKHPKHVSDGTMFSFSATVNNDRTIRADGSENFPKGYRELLLALDEMIGK